jgi:hypothetical protein
MNSILESLNAILEFLIIALAGSAISMTLSKSEIFEKFRDWVVSKNDFLGKLINCPYCTSHYVNFTLLVLCNSEILKMFPPVINYVVVVFAMITITSFFSGVIYKAMEQME